jgi:glycosyltransferase involved in cell wall biosynthesis
MWKKVDDPQLTAASLDREGIRRIYTGQRWRCLEPDKFNGRNHGVGRVGEGICRIMARQLGIDPGIGWIREAEKACSPLTARDADIILATGTPFAAFTVAKRVAERLKRPYVLDYRDPWTQNPHVDAPPRASVIRQETGLVHSAAAVTIVSPSWREVMERSYRLGSKLHVVTNGYDAEELSQVKPEPFDHFAIVYTGNFYPPKRVITPVMAALKKLKQASSRDKYRQWYFHYYGPQGNHVIEEAKRFDMLDRVIAHGVVPRKQALAAVCGAGLAVVITSVTQSLEAEDKGIVTGKVFEALGLKIPILLVSPSGSDVETVIEETDSGRCFSGYDVDGLAAFIAASMSGACPRTRNSNAYAWTHIAQKLDSVMRECVTKAATFLDPR